MDMKKISADTESVLLLARAEAENETALIEEEARLRLLGLGISMTPRTDPNKKENEPEKNG